MDGTIMFRETITKYRGESQNQNNSYMMEDMTEGKPHKAQQKRCKLEFKSMIILDWRFQNVES